VPPFPQALFTVQKQPQECRLQEERKSAFHGQRLAYNAAGKARELRPVGAELKFHGDAGDDTERKVDAENLRPEARRFIVGFVASAHSQRLEHDNQRRKAHRQLWK
jgi:hypothetical protein